MIAFEHPQWLWGLIAVPILFLFEWRAARRADGALRTLVGRRSPHPLLLQRLPGSRRVSIGLRMAALVLLVLGASGPESGRELVRRTASGSDVLLMIDVSASMDVRDVAPSRLDEARREALAVVDRLEGSRVGVVAFAGDAVRLCPLTQDLSAVRLVLESLSSSSVSTPGTDVGKALRMAQRVLPPGRREEQAVVMWTDGEDLEQGAPEAIDAIAPSGVRVFAVGVGTPAGDVVPVADEAGRVIDIKRDEAGSAVRSQLDENLLRTLARRTHGAYFSASRPGGELPRLLGALGTLARSGRGQRLVERPLARFPLCAGLAAALLIALLARPRRRVSAEDVIDVQSQAARAPGKGPGPAVAPAPRAARPPAPAAARVAVLVLAGMLGLVSASEAQSAWARADRAFRAGHYALAESLYALRGGQQPGPELRFNRATAALRAGKREAGERELGALASGRDKLAARAGYNLGTSIGQRQQFDPALDALRGSLERDPTNEDARWNYELLLRRKIQQQQQSQKAPPQQPDPQPKPAQPEPQDPGQSPKPNGSNPPPAAPQSGPSPPSPPPAQGSEGMTRAQAEQLLGALQDLARMDEQRQRKVRVMRERRGRDW